MRTAPLLTSALLFAVASTASSPFPVNTILDARQDDTPTTSSTSFNLDLSTVQGNTATTITSSAESSSGSNSASTASISGSDSSSNSGSQNGTSETSSQSSQATTKTYDARLPAGGVSLITPAAIATSYYKIKNDVVFVWNYTSLSATPSAVDVLAACATNSATYTIAANLTITNATQAVTWDTGAYQATGDPQLLTADYTLIIHDSAKDASAVAQAGYLGTFDSYTFGMYIPQQPEGLQQFKCVTCNGASTLMDKHTVLFMGGMATVTIFSFGWFGGIAGLW
nr:hypothetical protein CFP56_21968 [Quercus suber]